MTYGRDVRELRREASSVDEVPRAAPGRAKAERDDAAGELCAAQLARSRTPTSRMRDDEQQRVHRRRRRCAAAARRCSRTAPAPAGQTAGPPVAEDHGGEADEAPAGGLALAVEPGRDEREERAAEAGEGAGDDHRDVLVQVDVDAQRLGRVGLSPQERSRSPNGRAPQHEVASAGTSRTAMMVQERHVGGQPAQDARQVGHEEPAVVLQRLQRGRRCPGSVTVPDGATGGDCVGRRPASPRRPLGQVLGDAERRGC